MYKTIDCPFLLSDLEGGGHKLTVVTGDDLETQRVELLSGTGGTMLGAYNAVFKSSKEKFAKHTEDHGYESIALPTIGEL